MELFQESVFFGVLVSLASYGIGLALKIKTGWSLMNPLLIAIILVICVLLFTGVSYESYSAGANIISYLLTPATICLAVPLYQQVELLKKNYRAVMIGILSGVLASLCSVLILALLFHFDHASYVTFLPKSITTAIGIGVSEELGRSRISFSSRYHRNGSSWKHLCREVPFPPSHQGTDSKRYRHRLFCPCFGYG